MGEGGGGELFYREMAKTYFDALGVFTATDEGSVGYSPTIVKIFCSIVCGRC